MLCRHSNVDGHFQKAGFDPERVFEVHGNIHFWQCRRGRCGIWEAEGKVEVNEKRFLQCLPCLDVPNAKPMPDRMC